MQVCWRKQARGCSSALPAGTDSCATIKRCAAQLCLEFQTRMLDRKTLLTTAARANQGAHLVQDPHSGWPAGRLSRAKTEAVSTFKHTLTWSPTMAMPRVGLFLGSAHPLNISLFVVVPAARHSQVDAAVHTWGSEHAARLQRTIKSPGLLGWQQAPHSAPCWAGSKSCMAGGRHPVAGC